VLTAEFKINFLAAASGERLVALGRVVKAGRTLTVAQAEALTERGGERAVVALLTATLVVVEGREGIAG
jgi:acyl-coenzyme A thioesterase PaaI-like protein